MPKLAKTAVTVNPTLPYTEISINGKSYKIAATYRALAIAEDDLIRRGYDVNILLTKLQPSMSGYRAQFAASLHAYHPEIDFEEAKDLINDDNLVEVINALTAMGKASRPEDKSANPPRPAAQ